MPLPQEVQEELERKRREEHMQAVTELRRLGPVVAPDQVLTTTDELLTRKLARRRFNELRTARVVTTQGSRYLSGEGDTFLLLLLAMVLLCAGRHRLVLRLADGARSIRNWFAALAALRASSIMILDWFDLRKRCAELGSMICHARQAKAALQPTALSAVVARGGRRRNCAVGGVSGPSPKCGAAY